MIESRQPARVVVRAPNWVGDAVMATPFFASLRQTFPQADITCLCRSMVADVFRHHPDIDEIMGLDESRGRSGWASARLNAGRVRKRKFDLAISLPNSFSSALIFFLAHVPSRVGYRGDWRRGMLTASMPFPAKGRRPHRVEGYLRLLRLVAVEPVIDREPRLFSGAEEIDQASIELSRHGITDPDSYIAIAVGAAQPNKMWMPERFAELVRRLSADGLRVVLVGSPAEKSLSEQVIGQSGGAVVNLAGSGSLLFTAEIIRRAAAFVGNDSGLAHVAAAVKTRAVVLSGPGDPTEVAPYSTNAATIAKQLFCKPCYKNYCWRKDKPLECLKLIAVDEVYKAVIAGI